MKSKWVVIGSSLILFLIACSLPALEFRRNENGNEVWPGGGPLLIGLLGPLVGCFAWLANPLLLLAIILLCFQRNKGAAISSALALLFSLNTWVLFSIDIPADEGGVGKLFLLKIREGTYVWMLSIAVVLIGSFLVPRKTVQEAPSVAD